MNRALNTLMVLFVVLALAIASAAPWAWGK
jgi:hypothetical protein